MSAPGRIRSVGIGVKADWRMRTYSCRLLIPLFEGRLRSTADFRRIVHAAVSALESTAVPYQGRVGWPTLAALQTQMAGTGVWHGGKTKWP